MQIFANIVQAVCFPNSTTDATKADPNAPCNAYVFMQSECIYGTDNGLKAAQDALNSVWRSPLRKRDAGPPQLSNDTQRQCVCQSQIFDAFKGCQACINKHSSGAALPADVLPGGILPGNDQMDALSKSYCAVTATPTAGFGEELYGLVSDVPGEQTTSVSTTLTVSDPLGNKTDVSLYYTPTVTGKAFWCPAIPTGSPFTSNGQIVAATTATGSCTDVAAAASATRSSGADRLTVVGGGALMVLGGLVAVL